VLAGRGWHPGVIGIVAGRIKEKTGKPALVIALDADEAGHGKGSGRSIAGVDLGAAIIAAREAGCWSRAAAMRWRRADHRSGDKLDALGDWLDDRLGGAIVGAMAQQFAAARSGAGARRADAGTGRARWKAPGRSAWAGPARAWRWGRCAF
jgi:single-stranded-DNA-specific exonuclease